MIQRRPFHWRHFMLNVLVAVEQPVWQKGFQAILNTRSIDVRLRYAGSIDGLFRQQSLKEYDVVIFNLHSSDKHQLLDSCTFLEESIPKQGSHSLTMVWAALIFWISTEQVCWHLLMNMPPTNRLLLLLRAAARGSVYLFFDYQQCAVFQLFGCRRYPWNS